MTVNSVRQSLLQRFIPENIGSPSIDMEYFIAPHINSLSNQLKSNQPEQRKAILYIDGTYCYIPKSRNFQVPRQSFSSHRRRYLLKPSLIVIPDGFILEIQRPYFADSRNEDARNLRNEFEQV